MLINGRQFDWSQIIINLSNGAQSIAGVDAINYSDSQEVEFKYGAGRMPVGRGYGNYAATGSITLHMEEIEALQASVPSGNLMDIAPFSISVTFNHPNAAKIVNHVLADVVFTGNGRSVSQNDKSIAQELQLSISHIQWNGSPWVKLVEQVL